MQILESFSLPKTVVLHEAANVQKDGHVRIYMVAVRKHGRDSSLG